MKLYDQLAARAAISVASIADLHLQVIRAAPASTLMRIPMISAGSRFADVVPKGTYALPHVCLDQSGHGKYFFFVSTGPGRKAYIQIRKSR